MRNRAGESWNSCCAGCGSYLTSLKVASLLTATLVIDSKLVRAETRCLGECLELDEDHVWTLSQSCGIDQRQCNHAVILCALVGKHQSFIFVIVVQIIGQSRS